MKKFRILGILAILVQAGDDVGVGKIVCFDCRQVCCMCVHGRASSFLKYFLLISSYKILNHKVSNYVILMRRIIA